MDPEKLIPVYDSARPCRCLGLTPEVQRRLIQRIDAAERLYSQRRIDAFNEWVGEHEKLPQQVHRQDKDLTTEERKENRLANWVQHQGSRPEAEGHGGQWYVFHHVLTVRNKYVIRNSCRDLLIAVGRSG